MKEMQNFKPHLIQFLRETVFKEGQITKVMSDFPSVAPNLSTVQTDETFLFQRYQSEAKDRSSYLGEDVGQDNTQLRQKIEQYYALESLVKYLEKNPQYEKITLQFPDTLVADSAIVVQLLQEHLPNVEEAKLTECKDPDSRCSCGSRVENMCGTKGKSSGRKVWILADTAYSSCCVDEVASQHVNGDLVVHFGDACLNAIQNLPVVYCFGKPFADIDKIVAKFQETYSDMNEKVCLMANTPYTFHLRSIYEGLKSLGYNNVIYSDINIDLAGEKATIVGYEHNSLSHKQVCILGNRKFYSDENHPEVTVEQLQQDYQLFHITMPQDPRLLYLTTKFQSVAVYEPQDNSVSEGPFPSMMKRYKFMHMARTAGTIGILVNTLSLRNTKETVNSLAKLIKENGKKHYMFVVGKPNVAKLANFEPIDIWCVLGCGQSGIVLDQYNEFYKPIITPYELTMALNPEITWTGKWIVDFKEVLQEIGVEEEGTEQIENNKNEEGQTVEEYESDAPEFNAVTGQYVSTSRPLRNIGHLEIESPAQEVKTDGSDALVKQFSGALTIKNTVSTSAAHLQSRNWTGLGSDYNTEDYEEDGATVEEGISGVARGYQFDVLNTQ